MRIQALWFGGPCYATPTQDDIEDFRSLKRAKEVFENRASFDPMFPCTDNTEMNIYWHEYSENGPDRILKIGPRGGVRMEMA